MRLKASEGDDVCRHLSSPSLRPFIIFVRLAGKSSRLSIALRGEKAESTATWSAFLRKTNNEAKKKKLHSLDRSTTATTTSTLTNNNKINKTQPFLSLPGLLQEDRGQGRRPLHGAVLRHVAMHRQVRGPEADAAAQVGKEKRRRRSLKSDGER